MSDPRFDRAGVTGPQGGRLPSTAVTPSAPVFRSGRYDSAKRKRVRRSGREAGCWVYIAADEQERAGYTAGEGYDFYRVWGSSRGGLFVRLYKEA